jgi:hypothetical protein
MAKPKEPVNPFYVLLVLVGIVFLVTACAYGVMAYRAITPAPGGRSAPHPLTEFLDKRGIEVMGWELGALAVMTFGAMWLDGRRTRREERRNLLNAAEGGGAGRPSSREVE